MHAVESRINRSVPEHHSTAVNAVRRALEEAQVFPATFKQQRDPDNPGEFAAAIRLTGQALATAAKAAEGEFRKLREHLNESETRARAAEERAQAAEKQVAEWETLLGHIRDQILGKIPYQRAA